MMVCGGALFLSWWFSGFELEQIGGELGGGSFNFHKVLQSFPCLP
jgi:hypothetical protein